MDTSQPPNQIHAKYQKIFKTTNIVHVKYNTFTVIYSNSVCRIILSNIALFMLNRGWDHTSNCGAPPLHIPGGCEEWI